MMIVGLTGGIGSGKSTVTEQFSKLGVPIIDTDIIAREVVEPEQPAYHAIIKEFGKAVLTKNNQLNRAALKQRIINNESEREILEGILHPIIYQHVESQIQQLTSEYCIIVIPLLVETGRYMAILDRILVVDVPVAEQIARTSRRDGLDKPVIEKLISIQASREDRLSIADDVIENDKGREELSLAIQEIHAKYLKLCNKTP